VAAERGVSTEGLVELLREAVDALAVEYEDTANASLGQLPLRQEDLRAARRGRPDPIGGL
jgi:hypothetical protein